MLWVCRAGKNAKYVDYFVKNNRMYLAWDGYRVDLSERETIDEFKQVVISEKGEANRVSVSNWGSQLLLFCKTMKIHDYVLIPKIGSRSFVYAEIMGNYEYDGSNKLGLYHSREIRIVCEEIKREEFSQTTQYSLGAFRTVFKAKNEKEITEIIERNMK